MPERLPKSNREKNSPFRGEKYPERNPFSNLNEKEPLQSERDNFNGSRGGFGESVGPANIPLFSGGEVQVFPKNTGQLPIPVGALPRTRLPNEEARILVDVNRAIADDSTVRLLAQRRVDKLLDRLKKDDMPPLTPDELARRNIRQNLQSPEFVNFFKKITHSNQRLRTLTKEIEMFDMDAVGFGGNPADMTPALFGEIFQDEKLLASWIKNVDKRVKRSSQENIKEIDKKAETGEVVKKDVVLVGGGPMTSHLASILGPYFDVTVITEQDSIGKPWRDRPMYINSSVSVEGVYEPRLPLLGGTTTPVSLSKQLNNLDTDVLLGGDALRVSCDDGTQRQYVSGMRLGDLVATEIVFNAKDYIVGQRVDNDITINSDNTKRLTIKDKEGKTRMLDASAVFFLSGPGQEVSKLEDPGSQFAYEDSAALVQKQIAKERADRTKGEIALPKILTLTSIEQLMDYWQNDLERDPKKWPFAPLFDPSVSIANVGGGDTSRIHEEFLKGRGPSRAYPKDFNVTGPMPRTSLFNVAQTIPSEYDAENRRRYKGGIDRASLVVPAKADFIFYDPTQFNPQIGPDGAQISYQEAPGQGRTESFDYAVVATGLERTPLEEKLLGGLTRVIDDEGVQVGYGNEDFNVYLGGSATGFVATDFPEEVQNIIEGLGISENTISLWAHGLLLNRMGWRFLQQNGPNSEKVLALAA